MSVGRVARGGLFLFIGSIIAAVLGFVYWFLVSIYSGAGTVGVASSVYNLSALVSGIAALGVPAGVQRFFGRSLGQKDTERLNTYFWSSLVFMLVLCMLSGFLVWAIALLGVPLMNFSESMLFWTGLLTFFGFYGVAIALLCSIVKTEYVAFSLVVSAAIRLVIGISLVRLGLGWIGAVLGLLSEILFMAFLLLVFGLRELRRLGGIMVRVKFGALCDSMRAGLASWLPGVVALTGQQLSFLAVFGLQGNLQAGSYYIAFAIFSIIYMLPSNFMSILFPILSGLTDGGREVAWRVLKLSLGLVCPLTAFLVFYSSFPLSIMGTEYIQAGMTLSVLALSAIPSTFISTIYSLVYAAGSYGKVIAIGLATNVPRVVLYFLLIPIYGEFGAALSFFMGALVGLSVSTLLTRRSDYRFSFRKSAIAIGIPLAVAIPCFLLELNWFVGGVIILIVSVLCFGRFGVVERADLTEIARGFASEKTIDRMGQRLSWVLRIVYGE